MKDIKLAHDWFAFDHKGHHYEFEYRHSEADLDGYGNEINFLKKASAEDILKEYGGD